MLSSPPLLTAVNTFVDSLMGLKHACFSHESRGSHSAWFVCNTGLWACTLQALCGIAIALPMEQISLLIRLHLCHLLGDQYQLLCDSFALCCLIPGAVHRKSTRNGKSLSKCSCNTKVVPFTVFAVFGSCLLFCKWTISLSTAPL